MGAALSVLVLAFALMVIPIVRPLWRTPAAIPIIECGIRILSHRSYSLRCRPSPALLPLLRTPEKFDGIGGNHTDEELGSPKPFNVMAVNQDDHVKNLSFQMDSEGTWSLTPAYDVTFARGMGWTSEHQMRIRDKRSGIRRDDLRAIASEFGVKKADAILAEIRDVLGEWERHARRYAVDEDVREIIREEIHRREKVLAGTRDEMPTEPPELLVGQPES